MKANANHTCSTRDAAKTLGISVRTAQLWVEDGRLLAWKTPGGHRRILVSSVEQLLSEQKNAANGNGQESLSILVIDTEGDANSGLASELGRRLPDCRVIAARNAFEGLLRMDRTAPDVLIADAKAVGVENLQAINTLPMMSGKSRLLIVLSDNPSAVQAQTGLPTGFTLLARQERPDELIRLLDAYLRGCHNHRQYT